MSISPTIPNAIEMVDRRAFIDQETLRVVEQYLSQSLITDRTELRPDSYDPDKVVAELNGEIDSTPFKASQLVVWWFTNGDFSIQFAATVEDSNWQCRWDRHRNNSASRTHFHYPPSGELVKDLSLDSVHPIDVLSAVVAAITNIGSTLE